MERTLNGLDETFILEDQVSPNAFLKTDADNELTSQAKILNNDINDNELSIVKINTLATRLSTLDTEMDAVETLKANIASPIFTGNVGGISKAMVDLGNVDNTSDNEKPISYLQGINNSIQASLINLKANIASPTFTGTVGGVTKSMGDLGNVDNTTDLLKPVSAATQVLLNTLSATKANIASPTFTGNISGITKSMVDLGNVDNTSDANKPISTATQALFNYIGLLKANIASPSFTGTVSGITKSMVDLGNCDNTSDANKPISNAVITAITSLLNNMTILSTNLTQKANIASPTFTGNVSGIQKSMVGLGNCDNTTDVMKPISSATQIALNAKLYNTYAHYGIIGQTVPHCNVQFQGYQTVVNIYGTNYVAWNTTYQTTDVNKTINMKFPYFFTVYAISLQVDGDPYGSTLEFQFETDVIQMPAGTLVSQDTGTSLTFQVGASSQSLVQKFPSSIQQPMLVPYKNFRLRYTSSGSVGGASKEFNVVIHGYQA